MQSSACFAYSLSQVEEGWRWSVYDQDGVTIAGGADPSRHAAQAAVDLTLRHAEAQRRTRFAESRSWDGTTKRGHELIARS